MGQAQASGCVVPQLLAATVGKHDDLSRGGGSLQEAEAAPRRSSVQATRRSQSVWDGPGVVRAAKHGKGVNRVAWLSTRSKGVILVSASSDGTVKGWAAAESGTECAWSASHRSSSVCALVAYASSSGRPRAATADRTIRVWDGETGRPVRQLEGHQALVWSLSCLINSLGSPRLVSASQDRTVRVWDDDSGACLHVLSRRTSRAPFVSVASAVVHGDAAIASGSADGGLTLWNAETGELVLDDEDSHKAAVATVVAAHHTAFPGRLLFATGSHTARIYEARPTPRVALELLDDCGGDEATLVRCVAWSPDDRILATSAGSRLVLWSALDGSKLATLQGHIGTIECLEWLGQNMIATASSDGAVRVSDASSGDLVHPEERHADYVGTLAALPAGGPANDNGFLLATGSDDATVRVRHVRRRRRAHEDDEPPQDDDDDDDTGCFFGGVRGESELSVASVIRAMEELGKAPLGCEKRRKKKTSLESRLACALREVDELVGCEDVKRRVAVLAHRAVTSAHRIAREDLNFVIDGPTGTGKTRIARCLASVLVATRAVSDEVVWLDSIAAIDATRHLGKVVIVDDDNDEHGTARELRASLSVADEGTSSECALCSASSLERFLGAAHQSFAPGLGCNTALIVVVSSPRPVALPDRFAWRFASRFSLENHSPGQLEAVFRRQLADLGWRLEDLASTRGLFSHPAAAKLFFAPQTNSTASPFANGAGTMTLAHWTTTLIASSSSRFGGGGAATKDRTVSLSDLRLTLDVMRGSAPPTVIETTNFWASPASVALSLAKAAATPYTRDHHTRRTRHDAPRPDESVDFLPAGPRRKQKPGGDGEQPAAAQHEQEEAASSSSSSSEADDDGDHERDEADRLFAARLQAARHMCAVLAVVSIVFAVATFRGSIDDETPWLDDPAATSLVLATQPLAAPGVPPLLLLPPRREGRLRTPPPILMLPGPLARALGSFLPDQCLPASWHSLGSCLTALTSSPSCAATAALVSLVALENVLLLTWLLRLVASRYCALPGGRGTSGPRKVDNHDALTLPSAV